MENKLPHLLQPDRWIERYADSLLNFAFFRVNNKMLAEDLVQDTFVAALHSMHNFKGNSQEKTWLHAILENKIIDYFRSSNYNFQKQTVAIGVEFFGNFFERDTEGNYGHWQKDREPSAWGKSTEDAALENDEFYRTLFACLHKLPQKIARVFTMKNMEDYETQEICKELEISTTNYWVMIHRAKLQLRECLEKNWFNTQK